MLSYFLAALESDADRQAFATIYDQYHAKMENTAMKILRNQDDTEDAVQNAFMQVIRYFEKTYQIPCEDLPFWLISIVKNEAYMILRKQKNIVPLEDWIDYSNQSVDVMDYVGLVELFAELPNTYRQVLEMKGLLGYSNKEIAAHLGITESAVGTRVSRGRRLLKEILDREGFEL